MHNFAFFAKKKLCNSYTHIFQGQQQLKKVPASNITKHTCILFCLSTFHFFNFDISITCHPLRVSSKGSQKYQKLVSFSPEFEEKTLNFLKTLQILFLFLKFNFILRKLNVKKPNA